MRSVETIFESEQTIYLFFVMRGIPGVSLVWGCPLQYLLKGALIMVRAI